MSYGVSILNSQGHKVIQDGDPIYALKRSGTLNPVKTGSVTGWYAYDVSVSAAEPTGTEEVLFQLDVGNWIAHQPWYIWLGGPPWQFQYFEPELSQYNSLWNHKSNQSTLPYYVFDRMDNIPGAGAATGYGMQVFDSNGTVCWDSNEITNRVSKAGTVTTSGASISSTANAVSLRSWYCDITRIGPVTVNTLNNVRSYRATRVSSSSWDISIGIVDKMGFSRSPDNNTTASVADNWVNNTADAHYLLGYV
jgi:hypothetical protein